MRLEYNPDDRVIVETDVRDIAFITNDTTDEEARRLVACWNALESFSTGKIQVHTFASYLSEVVNQRDDLLTALKYVQKKVEAGEDIGMSVINEAISNASN